MSDYQEGTIRPATLSVIVMPNGEILCVGKSIGWMDEKAPSCRDKTRKLGHYIEIEEMVEE